MNIEIDDFEWKFVNSNEEIVSTYGEKTLQIAKEANEGRTDSKEKKLAFIKEASKVLSKLED